VHNWRAASDPNPEEKPLALSIDARIRRLARCETGQGFAKLSVVECVAHGRRLAKSEARHHQPRRIRVGLSRVDVDNKTAGRIRHLPAKSRSRRSMIFEEWLSSAPTRERDAASAALALPLEWTKQRQVLRAG